ncbi:hypothetical protein I4U23_022847 [Adineta vaga]|nr:hypothetical protein I4U23_022847 [Adineta vaga]
MSTDNDNELILSDPWGIYFMQDDTQGSNYSINNFTQQTAGLTLNEQNAAVSLKNSCSWYEHEKLTGEILNQAAQRVAAETYKNICVYHPKQNHQPSQNGSNIRPDFMIAWSCDGVRRNTAVVDAKDYHRSVPKREYEKICRDMCETKATRGILVLGKHARISDSLRAIIDKDGKVDIIQMKNDQGNTIRDVTQSIGKLIDQNFVPDDKRWETYKPHVTSTKNPRERRQNPYGENSKYMCDSNYHHFNYPRKQDGTVDERYAANQDRNKYGDPDMRMVHTNKSRQTQEQHLNEDGSEDMRAKEHRERLVNETGHRLNVDGTLDKRCEENKIEAPINTSLGNDNNQTNGNIDMRLKDNREDLVDNQGHHLNIDASPDMRCVENKVITAPNISSNDSGDELLDNADMRLTENRENLVNDEDQHLNTDGSLDMRCKENQQEVNVSASDEGQLSMNPTVPDEISETNTAIPTKSDGTADMRYNASQDAVASGEISRDDVLNGGSGEIAESSSGMINSVESIGGDGSGDGPLKADGTPDMRFSANQ